MIGPAVTLRQYNYFQNKMAVENPLANKSSKKNLKKLKEHTVPLKAKEATIYGVNIFPKDKSTL
jgi:hypothetical protein